MTPGGPVPPGDRERAATWWATSAAAAVIALVASGIGLAAVDAIYGRGSCGPVC
ncbi:MAG: hypothetical protein HHJ14_09560 [Cellulomonas sp.]|uniref:hypothetical protein n=1 Tax=Cellulomonas sp. TaxID=40001 RepID=UPI0018133CD7|nr:hypothetical protein [Cellulomonas sp.]NMM17356.1 hypothetical protein [Cellulomonas sp.]NMM31833.1 hypothetical protein [Cellulomonas sp.]